MTTTTLAGARDSATSVATSIGCCVDAALAGTTRAQLRKAVYEEFLYGYGAAPGVNLGRPLAYTRSGPVYRQEFEGGVTLANISNEPVVFCLDRSYLDLDNLLQRHVLLRPHSADVLLRCGQR